MEQQQVEETFEDYMRNARDEFVMAVKNEERSNYLLTAIDSFLVCFDQMRERLTASPLPSSTSVQVEELIKEVGYIKINAEKINEHTWKVYKEQILKHIEEAEAIAASPKGKEEENVNYLRQKYKQWCEETKRNGSVLVGGSIYEFFDWLEPTGHGKPDLFFPPTTL